MSLQYLDYRLSYSRKHYRSFPHLRLITGCVTRLTLCVSLVEQDLLILPQHPSSPLVCRGVRVTRSLVLCVCFVDRYLFFCAFSFDHYLISSHSSCTVLSISSVIGFSRSLFFHLRILFTPFGIFNFFFLNFKNLQILVLHYFNHVFSRLLCESIIIRESDMCASNILDRWDKMCWLRHEIENKQNTWHSIFRGAFDWRIRKIE